MLHACLAKAAQQLVPVDFGSITVVLQLLDGRQYLLEVHRLSVDCKSIVQTNMVSCCHNISRSLYQRHHKQSHGCRGVDQDYGKPSGDAARQLKGFQLFLRTFAYNTEKDIFELVPQMPHHLPQQICQALHALQQIDKAGKEAT